MQIGAAHGAGGDADAHLAGYRFARRNLHPFE